jgi:hypothetical protein
MSAHSLHDLHETYLKNRCDLNGNGDTIEHALWVWSRGVTKMCLSSKKKFGIRHFRHFKEISKMTLGWVVLPAIFFRPWEYWFAFGNKNRPTDRELPKRKTTRKGWTFSFLLNEKKKMAGSVDVYVNQSILSNLSCVQNTHYILPILYSPSPFDVVLSFPKFWNPTGKQSCKNIWTVKVLTHCSSKLSKTCYWINVSGYQRCLPALMVCLL